MRKTSGQHVKTAEHSVSWGGLANAQCYEESNRKSRQARPLDGGLTNEPMEM